ncbi:phage terminase small subunit [Gallibacterium sp. AGMB14963]|uniref:phage terminase small subunit n=1 Tax=Gallibacterium faecale TaxID=3019086 RepID=UPI0022F15936|nr:phage terminase small subunit [Gallibacterium sp. AGMB14963]MDA3979032.1 phage terminase small subunit [Gallibacterium sp. AGMB14963]
MGFRDYQKRVIALKQLEQQTPDQVHQTMKNTNATTQVLEIALNNDIARIREISSLADRAEYKRNHFLPKWLPFVEEYLQKGEIYQNDVLIYCIVYLFDVGNIAHALQLAERAIAENQLMPSQFKSNLPTFVADQVFAWADNLAAAAQSVEPYFSQTFEKVANAWRLHEIITAKWYKLAASILLRNKVGKIHAASIDDINALVIALYLIINAKQIYQKCGVDSLIDRVEMRIKKLSPGADPTALVSEITFADAIAKLREAHLIKRG